MHLSVSLSSVYLSHSLNAFIYVLLLIFVQFSIWHSVKCLVNVNEPQKADKMTDRYVGADRYPVKLIFKNIKHIF